MGKKIVVLVTGQSLGQVTEADQQFGFEMLEKFFHTLESQAQKPHTICFFTEGVKLAVRGSAMVPALQLLEGMGIKLLLCHSCLEYFGLTGQVAVGQIGGMKEIVPLMLAADSVIRI